MDELRNKIIGVITDAGYDELGNVAKYADAILALPAIKEALEARRINAMSPSQFGAMLLDQLPDAPAKDA